MGGSTRAVATLVLGHHFWSCSRVRMNPLALGFSASLGTEGLAAPQKADGKMCFVFVLFFFRWDLQP